MGFRVVMAFAVFLIPGIMVFFGCSMRNHPPKTINAVYGYRTAMSMINQDTWDYAQAACAKRWRIWGRILVNGFDPRSSPPKGRGMDGLLYRL